MGEKGEWEQKYAHGGSGSDYNQGGGGGINSGDQHINYSASAHVRMKLAEARVSKQQVADKDAEMDKLIEERDQALGIASSATAFAGQLGITADDLIHSEATSTESPSNLFKPDFIPKLNLSNLTNLSGLQNGFGDGNAGQGKPDLNPPKTPSGSSRSNSPSPSVMVKFSKFAKMRGMGVPMGAIKHKMEMEGISESDIQLFESRSLEPARPKPTTPPPSKTP